ncbi:MAG: MFS transporter [Verrucomicrobiaceae bacterium]|nr:MAG: MFS transporter [Verrucomicrobiaceae bacterium]
MKPTVLRAGLPAILLAACGGLIQGFDTGGISNAAPAIVAHFHLPAAAQGLVTSLVLVGAMAGAAAGGLVADRLGRRGGLLACGLVFSAGVLLEILASVLPVLLCARVLAGLAIGAASIISTLYIAEVSPPEKRGGYLSFFQLAVVFGIVCGVLVAMAVGQHPGGWRLIMGAGIVPGLVLFFGMLAMPESPAWIAHRKSVKIEGGPKPGFSTPAVQLALVVGVGMALIQQITGINAVMYYAPGIFEKAGFDKAGQSVLDDLALAVLLTVVTFIASRIVDRCGRRALLLWGMGGMVAALAILGAAFEQAATMPAARWFVLGALLLYIAAFAIGPGPCIWLVIAEIYPMEVRGPAMSIATLASWFANLLVSSTFPAFSMAVGEANAFFIFGLITFLSWLFTFGLLPETSGRSLAEIQTIWRDHAALLFSHHKAPRRSG